MSAEGKGGKGRPGAGAPEGMADKPTNSALAALTIVAAFHHIPSDVRQISHELGLGHRPATPADIVRAAKMIGLKSRILLRQTAARLGSAPLPAIIGLNDGTYAVLGRKQADGNFRVLDPLTRQLRIEKEEDLLASWNGTIILATRRPSLEGAPGQFGLSWFRPSIWRYRYPLTSVMVASLFVQLCGLITPVFFQITIDKVLVHKGYATLYLVVAGLVIIGFFQSTLQYFRTYILSHTTSRIDVELGVKLFDHLLRLPLSYFETRAAGQTVARVREIETIRNFLDRSGADVRDRPFVHQHISLRSFPLFRDAWNDRSHIAPLLRAGRHDAEADAAGKKSRRSSIAER